MITWSGYVEKIKPEADSFWVRIWEPGNIDLEYEALFSISKLPKSEQEILSLDAPFDVSEINGKFDFKFRRLEKWTPERLDAARDRALEKMKELGS